MVRQIAWASLRLGITLFLYLPVAYAFFILIQTSSPRFLEMNWEAFAWLTVLLLVISYFFLHVARTKEFGKLFIISVLGVAVLMMYEGQYYSVGTQNISANALYVAFLYIIPAIHFVVPPVWTRSLLFLIPVSALTWFLRVSIYQPICFSYELYLTKPTLSPEQYDKAFELVLQSIPTMFIGGSMAFALLIPYWFALYGTNLAATYTSLASRLRQIRFRLNQLQWLRHGD
ncbi:hypothetical protein [Pseudoalteromonas ruthenica]|uniref:hypothetical protein n=1 Tax=Pseudoalteromonas ruthenica TaxID=151081 RepID=UPI00034D496A|nr:hypothetical protein [Pseudoalteromonas ruthenica]